MHATKYKTLQAHAQENINSNFQIRLVFM